MDKACVSWHGGPEKRAVVRTVGPTLAGGFFSSYTYFCEPQKIAFHQAQPCQRPRFARTYVCSKMLGLVWFMGIPGSPGGSGRF